MPRPVVFSLARCTSALAVGAALTLATAHSAKAAVNTWVGDAAPTPGDGFLWTNSLNWTGDLLPALTDDVTFAAPTASVGAIFLNGNQTVNSITLTVNEKLGAFGTSDVLTNTSGDIVVNPGVFGTMNASYGGVNGIKLTGGGSLYMNHPLPTFAGDISISGAGTTLVYRGDGVAAQYSGVASTQLFGRSDWQSLGFTTATRTITATNGGEFKILAVGNNAEGGHKNFVAGTGGGAYNIAAGYIQMQMDDASQLSNAVGNTFIKRGTGRLTILGNLAEANPFAGDVVIDRGVFEFQRLQGNSTTANTRFSGMTGTTSTPVGANTLTINNSGVLLLNNGTVGNLDVATVIANNGAILATQTAGHEIGIRTGGNVLQINGTVSMLHRDYLTTVNGRNFFINSDLTGSGILEIVPSTQAGSASRVVIQRSTAASTFDGTFRLTENANLEANPRFNAVANVGKVLAGGDIEFAGWGSTLDVRDTAATAAVLDYKDNEVSITTTQAGALNFILPTGATGAAGHLFNFGTLTMGNHRLALAVNTGAPLTNGAQTGFGDTAIIKGNATIEMRSTLTAGSFSTLVFNNAAALSEDAAGRSLKLIKTGAGDTIATNVISGGSISLSNLEVDSGNLILRGANGAITTGFGGAAPTITVNGGANGFANGAPTQGLLNLDSSTGHVVGATTVFAAGNNNNRIVDSAVVNMRSNSILRLTSAGAAQTTETIGTVNTSGHVTFDVVKTGVAPAPVALTLSTLNVSPKTTVNFTGGATLGTAVADSTRIVIPGTATGLMSSQYHVGNEWAKYNSGTDNGFELGVAPFAASDYTIGTAETTWAAGQQIKQNGATLPTLTANRTADRFNFQTTAANQGLNLAGFVLTADQGGIISSANTIGIIDGVTGTAPSAGAGITAGSTASSSQLYVYSNAQIDIRTPVRDNLAGGSVDFVKNGPGNVRLTHQSLGVGTAAANGGPVPFTAPTWTSTLTGSWIINDGRLDVHRGQFLGGRPVILNGGHLEINQPVSNANADSLISGWGNNITINGNASVVSDDNGESGDNETGDRTGVLLGSLTINNGSTFSVGGFSAQDIAYMGGTTINGKATFNVGTGRDATGATILNGVVSGSGFDVVAYNGTAGMLVLGGTQTDTAANTYNGAITIYGGTVRLNKANGVTAITDGSAAEDIVINGGQLLWGPGHHGDLSTTNNINTVNNGLAGGIAPTSPAAIKNAGMDQIADTATITLLNGTLGESDRITNEKFGTLTQKNGTVNVGMGTLEIGTMNVTGGALGFDRGGTLKVGTLNMLPGAYQLNVFTGLPTPTGHTTAEIGAGGLSLTGQNILLGSGFYGGNVAGSGGQLKLGGNVTVSSTALLGSSYTTGIYVQNGNSFRELGGSRIDLMGGNRDFNIDSDVQFYITPRIVNGGITKSGGGALILQPYEPNTFAGAVVVNGGTVSARSDGAFGTSAGGVTINNGGTVKLESSWTFGDDFTVSGEGALIPGDANVREIGALVSDSGTNRLTGAVALAGNATIASNIVIDPSAVPAAGGNPVKRSNLRIEGSGGVTGSGTLTLSGHGNGIIFNGVNTTSGGLVKDGAGRWIIAGPSTYSGATTVAAGALEVRHANALGTTGSGTTVYSGGSLQFSGGVSLAAEPLTINGAGISTQSGALVNIDGANTINSTVNLGTSSTLYSSNGTLTLANANSVTGVGSNLTLAGTGAGVIQGAIALGAADLTKNGTGTWTLFGGNTLTGVTSVNGGTLALNYTTNNSSKLNATGALNFGGGDLAIIGNAAAATSQTVSGTNFLSGNADITVTNGGGQSATLGLGALSRSAGATANFVLPSTGAITTSATNTNGILGGYATVGGTNWATVSGSNITAFSAYTALNPAGVSDSSNALVTFGQIQTGATSVNSLKIDNGAGLGIGTSTVTLASGGLLYAGNGISGISGAAGSLLKGTTVGDELIIHTSGGVLDIGVPIIGAGNGSLTKTGNGTLALRANSDFTGSINVNGGMLVVPAPGAHPNALGGSVVNANRLINLNGGGFEALGDYDLNDYDGTTTGVQSMQFAIGPAGGTFRSRFGNLIINDAGQLQGSGDVTFTGGGRYSLNGLSTSFAGFGGNITVDGGILTASHSASLGGRQEQTLTLKPGSAIINQADFTRGLNGLPNNMVVQGGTEIYALGGNRVFSGDIQLSGTNTIALMERDNLSLEKQIYFNGRVSGTGVTLNVFGVNNGNPFYLTGGSNDLTGTINLNTNAVLEARTPGSLGVGTGDVTVNLAGANSRLLLRSYQNANYRTNVVVSDNAEINSDRLTQFAAGTSQLLSINNLTLNGSDKFLTFGGGNGYTTRVEGTATFNANTVINATSNVLFENGITFAGGANTLDKRGGGSIILRGASNHTGATLVQQGVLLLQGANGALPNSNSIELRGGELRIDNSDAINPNRLNDAGTLVLGGGVLRVTGAETLPTVSAVAGTTQVINNPTSETTPTPMTLTGFTRALGAIVQFQSPDVPAPGAVGSATLGQTRVSSRILIPGQADTTQTIPGLLGNNNLDFVQYDGTTLDNGVALGVRDMRNPTSINSPSNYTNDPAETAWNDSVIARLTTATVTTLTANRSLDAMKIEGGATPFRQVAFGTNTLRIEGAGILAVGQEALFTGTGGFLTAGPATPGTSTAELIIGGNNTLRVAPTITNNGTQPVALVKTGTGTLELSGTNNYTGGTFINSGTLNLLGNANLGAASNPVVLSGGTLQFNIPNAANDAALGGLGQNVTVNGSSLIVMDNGNLAGLDGNLAMGSLNINGAYTLGIRGFDSLDITFSGSHTFAGSPLIDLPQAGSGSNPNTAATASTVTINGPIAGSGFFVGSSGATNDAAARLQIGGGASDTAPNTYTGKVTLLPGSNNEDLFVELNKADNTTAITGDLQLDGGTVISNFSNQIADTSKLLINRGVLNLNGKNETIASVNMTGGGLITNPTTGTPTANSVTITGDVDVTGISNFAGVSTGFTIGNNSTVTIGGKLRIGTFGRVHLAEGATAAVLNIDGGLEMTGALLHQNSGAGANIVRLNSDVTTFASPSTSNLGNSTDSDTFLELSGARTFDVADGSAAIDLAVSTIIRNGTTPGSLTKNGEGTVQIQGGGAANTYSGGTTVNAGSVILFKSAGTNALPAGNLTIGDGIGGAKADKVIPRNSNQIADAANVTIGSSGVLDLETFNASETIGSLSGSGAVDLGSGSTFTVNSALNTTYAGSIQGAGAFVKDGGGLLELTGSSDIANGTRVNLGRLLVNGTLNGSVNVAAAAILGGAGTINGPLSVDGTLAPGASPGDLTVNGTVALNAGSVLAIELNGSTAGTGHDQLTISSTGAVSITGGTLTLALNFVPTFGQQFTVIENLSVGAIGGAFSNVADGGIISATFNSVQYDFVADYEGGNGNDLVLTVPEPTSFTALAVGMGLCAGLRRFRRRSAC